VQDIVDRVGIFGFRVSNLIILVERDASVRDIWVLG